MYAKKKTVVPIKRVNLRIDMGLLGKSVVLGIPSFIQSAGMSILMLLVNTTLGVYGGDEAITTYGMVHKLLMIVIMPILGIAQGFQPLAGYNYGAKRFDRVRTSLWTAALTAFSIALFGYAFMMLLPRVGMSFFTHDEGLIASSARVLRIVVLFIPAAAIQITGSVYFQSVGKGTEDRALSLSRQFLLLIPFVLILPRFFGLAGVWVAFPLADLLSSTITVTLLIKEVRKLARA